ncbi:MAG TPA: hypothetical protein VFV67_34180 [Actinophytocola sp.]|uniref:hypothetical protein n=1 Tax=Actinophytocola sp. TaxID=1872138 RepID=UPI002DB6EC18|nr:hypothetical protein [Actinophytocola sp.]HEU5475717.1 hypothetical protein [Actinophytocola sp.]
MALMVGQIQALITADKSQYTSTVKAAGAEHQTFVSKTSKQKAVIDGDEKPLERATKRSVQLVGSMRARIGGFMGEIRGEFLKVGAVAGIIGGLREVVMAASDLSESANAINVTFAGAQQSVFAFTKTASAAIGQSDTQARQAVATFGTYGKQAGLAAEQNAEFSISLTKLASDLASFKNTTPEEAIEALGAALRGESDPIEKYGVLLNESVIAQRALKMGVIATTSQALTPQQRVMVAYQEILAQTKDAQGDFGRTSGELANQLRTAKAVVIDKAAALGQQLLPAAKATVGFFTGAVGPVFDGLGAILKVVIGAVGQLAQIWQSLPGPVQAAVVAMVAWRLVQERVEAGVGAVRDKVQGLNTAVQQHGGVLDALRARFSVIDSMATSYDRASTATTNHLRAQVALAVGLGGVNDQMSATQRATQLAGDGLARVAGIASGTAAAAFTGLRSAASGLMSFLGGPWGVALAVAGVALSVWMSRQQQAKQAAEQHAAKVRSLTEAIIANGGALSAQSKMQQVAEARSKGLYDIAQKLGISNQTMTEAILGNAEAIGRVNSAFDQFGISASQITGDAETLRAVFDGFGGISAEKWGSLARALVESRQNFGLLSGGMLEAQNAANANSDALAEVGVKAEDLGAATGGATPPTSAMAKALKALGDNASDADTQVSGLKTALDEYAGKRHTVEEATQAVNDSLRDLGAAFKGAKADAAASKQPLLDSSGAINTVTEKGSALQNTLMGLSDAYRQQFAAIVQNATAQGKTLPEAVAAATAATAKTRESFIAAAVAAGIARQDAEKLADQYDLMPTAAATAILQPGMVDAIKNAGILSDKVVSVPDSKTIIVSSTTPQQIAFLENLGFKVRTLPNGHVEITSNAAAVNEDINNAARDRRTEILISYKAAGIPNAAKLAKEAVTQGSGGVMEYYGAGGLRPMSGRSAGIVASYRRTGTMRVIGDNPRVDELFLPLDRFSARSQALLDEALRRMRPEWFRSALPMAAGGVYPAGGDSASTVGRERAGHTFNITGPDPGAVTRMVMDELRAEEALYAGA